MASSAHSIRTTAQLGHVVRLAARNGWLGHEITSPTLAINYDRLATGSDVAANYMYTLFYPKVTVNQALSIQGSYRIGSWNPLNQSDAAFGQLNTSRYLNSQTTGLGSSFSPGYWETWYAQAQLALGKPYNRKSAKHYRSRCDYRLPGKHR